MDVRRCENMVGVNMAPAWFIQLWGCYARTMFTPTMFSRGRDVQRHFPERVHMFRGVSEGTSLPQWMFIGIVRNTFNGSWCLRSGVEYVAPTLPPQSYYFLAFDSKESSWSGWNALRGALEAGGPWLQGAIPWPALWLLSLLSLLGCYLLWYVLCWLLASRRGQDKRGHRRSAAISHTDCYHGYLRQGYHSAALSIYANMYSVCVWQ